MSRSARSKLSGPLRDRQWARSRSLVLTVALQNERLAMNVCHAGAPQRFRVRGLEKLSSHAIHALDARGTRRISDSMDRLVDSLGTQRTLKFVPCKSGLQTAGAEGSSLMKSVIFLSVSARGAVFIFLRSRSTTLSQVMCVVIVFPSARW